ncbi:FecR family protein [Parabacteroides sp. ASD2025]|jgi:transmembrane sensor|uniref:FecR family protein n=1 Tax=Parabacteroides sp. ASD2025 TaxID=3415987 RepID=UPI0025D49857|nr:FecR domain-containing protein [uncultured Parabacteroides sp.]
MERRDKNIPWKAIIRKFKYEISEKEQADLDVWLADEENHARFQSWQSLWLSIMEENMRYISNVDALWKRMEKRMKKAEPRVVKLPLRSFRMCTAVVAALFILLFSFAGYMTTEWYKASNTVLVYSSLNGKSRVCLPDSTLVWLNTGSTLEYFVSRWSKERNVRLKGEAYFDVSEDPERLFVVEGGGVVVKVHGTVFNMKAREKQEYVDVSLLSGLVVVENSGVSRNLNPGETAICKRNSPSIEKKTTDASIACLWTKGALRFEKKTIYELVGYLSEWYGMEIRLDPLLPTDQAYTFSITHEPLEEVLSLIAKITPIEYVFDEDNTVRITRK